MFNKGNIYGVCAWGLERIGAINHWHQFKTKWFTKDAHGALVLLGLWPMALVFPAAVPMGLGQVLERLEEYLGEALADTAFLEWLPMRSVELEPLLPGAEVMCVMLGALVPILLGYSVIKHTSKRFIFMMACFAIAVIVSSLSTALSFGPEHTWAWISLPVQVGLIFAIGLAVLFLILPVRACLALLLLVRKNNKSPTTKLSTSIGLLFSYISKEERGNFFTPDCNKTYCTKPLQSKPTSGLLLPKT